MSQRELGPTAAREGVLSEHVRAPGRQAYRFDAGEAVRLVSPEHAVPHVGVQDVGSPDISVWRPIGAPIHRAPLGFVRPSSVADDDWVLLDLIYPDRLGHIMGVVAHPTHEWVYQSRMTLDDVAHFNIYDHGGQAAIADSAIDDLVEDDTASTVRRSIGSRILVRNPGRGARV